MGGLSAAATQGPEPGERRVDYWLNEWSRWYRQEPIRLGYPHHVSVARGGGHSRRTAEFIEDQEFGVWQRNCQAMDALIESLPPSQCVAIRSEYLGEPWRFPRDNKPALLLAAFQALLIGMNARDVL